MSEDDFTSDLNRILLDHDAAILEEPLFSKRVEVRRQTRKEILEIARQLSPDSRQGETDG